MIRMISWNSNSKNEPRDSLYSCTRSRNITTVVPRVQLRFSHVLRLECHILLSTNQLRQRNRRRKQNSGKRKSKYKTSNLKQGTSSTTTLFFVRIHLLIIITKIIKDGLYFCQEFYRLKFAWTTRVHHHESNHLFHLHLVYGAVLKTQNVLSP